MNLARSSVKLFAARFGSSVLQFLAIVYLESTIGLSQLGVFFLYQAVLGISAIPADFGLAGAVEKRVSEGTDANKYATSVVLLKLVPLTIVCLVIIVFSDMLASYVGTDIAGYLIIGLVLHEASKLVIAILKGEMRVEETAILEILLKVVWVVLGIILVQYGFTAEALIIADLSGAFLIIVIGLFKISVKFQMPSEEHILSLLTYGKHNFISSVGGYFYNWTDIIMIGYFLSESHVAAYEIAWRITSFTIIYSRALSTALFPQVSAWHSSSSSQEIENKITELLGLSPLIVVPAFFGVALYSEQILTLVFSEEAAIASLALVILMVDEVTESVQTILGKSLQAVDRPDLAARATVVSVILNVVLNWLLIWNFGIAGAALATTVASLVGGVLLHAFYLNDIVSLRFPTREWAECCLAASLMATCLAMINRLIAINTLLRLSLVITIGILLYFWLLSHSPSIRLVVKNQIREYRDRSVETDNTDS